MSKTKTKTSTHTNTVGKRIDELKRHLRYTERAFATLIGISGPGLSKITSGKSKPGFEVLRAILEKTKVSNDWLMKGKGEMFPPKNPEANARVLGMVTDLEFISLPLIDAKAVASFSDNIWQDLAYASTLRSYPILKQSGANYNKA